ncbi:hypothetical protein [Butyrivibrio proteoclasticus]|uniref:hypothetical protein n=1 Tax=Butyrivibrio proteoclasticus TaxID=43305 RepID=UPI00047E3FD7|nr:hypothetical protein [Butyrivibrio proteoclasticus]
MPQKSGTGRLVGGIISTILAVILGFPGVILTLFSLIFVIGSPIMDSFELNGEMYYGDEASKMALSTGGKMLIVALILDAFVVGFVFLAVKLFKGYAKIERENQMARQYGMYPNAYQNQQVYGMNPPTGQQVYGLNNQFQGQQAYGAGNQAQSGTVYTSPRQMQ